MRKQTVYPCPLCDGLLVEKIVPGPTNPSAFIRRAFLCDTCVMGWRFIDLATDGGIAALTNMTEPYS